MRWDADVRIAGPVGSMSKRVSNRSSTSRCNVLTALDEQAQSAARDH